MEQPFIGGSTKRNIMFTITGIFLLLGSVAMFFTKSVAVKCCSLIIKTESSGN